MFANTEMLKMHSCTSGILAGLMSGQTVAVRVYAISCRKVPSYGLKYSMHVERLRALRKARHARAKTDRLQPHLRLCAQAGSYPSTEMLKDTYGNISASPAPPSPS